MVHRPRAISTRPRRKYPERGEDSSRSAEGREDWGIIRIKASRTRLPDRAGPFHIRNITPDGLTSSQGPGEDCQYEASKKNKYSATENRSQETVDQESPGCHSGHACKVRQRITRNKGRRQAEHKRPGPPPVKPAFNHYCPRSTY